MATTLCIGFINNCDNYSCPNAIYCIKCNSLICFYANNPSKIYECNSQTIANITALINKMMNEYTACITKSVTKGVLLKNMANIHVKSKTHWLEIRGRHIARYIILQSTTSEFTKERQKFTPEIIRDIQDQSYITSNYLEWSNTIDKILILELDNNIICKNLKTLTA